MVDAALAFHQRRCGIAVDDNPLAKTTVTTNLLGYIHSVVSVNALWVWAVEV